jgi:hypothetical protein
MTAPLTKLAQLKKVHKPKRKRCKLKSCNKLFVPGRAMQPCCSFAHEFEYATSNIDELVKVGAKLRDKEKRAAKLKTTLKKRVQDLANKYGRLREKSRGNNFCVTCGSPNAKDGGHFLPTSQYRPIRYYTLQINPQCITCNQYNGGMRAEYREYMIKRFGLEKVLWLESNKQGDRKYSTEYYEKYLRVMRKRIKRYEQ